MPRPWAGDDGQTHDLGPQVENRPDSSGSSCALTVQRFLKLSLGRLRQRRLQDGAAVLAERGDGLVRRSPLDDEEERGRAGFHHVLDLILEGFVDTTLLDLSHEG